MPVELADERATRYQVSTSTALVEGVYRGAITVGQLLRHGDFGLGTFEGEMAVFCSRRWSSKLPSV